MDVTRFRKKSENSSDSARRDVALGAAEGPMLAGEVSAVQIAKGRTRPWDSTDLRLRAPSLGEGGARGLYRFLTTRGLAEGEWGEDSGFPATLAVRAARVPGPFLDIAVTSATLLRGF